MFRFTSFFTVLVVLVGVGQAQGESIYMDFGDIKGDVTEKPHDGWINILAISHGVGRSPIVSGSGDKGDATLTDMFVTKELDKSTPMLLESILSGRVHKEVVIDFVASIAEEKPETLQYQIKLENVSLTSYSFSDTAGGGPASENFSLNFEKIEWFFTEFKDEKEEGTFDFGWDVVNAEPLSDEVPEPGTLTLAALALVGLVTHGHHRRRA